ncbi:hypothetical protein L6164_028752 [Bauhinia variegata]|uniref:Uncharacterized protein n=1 Tax=Bauhinia variegata TaxID=167791 RepID=A0ACB9L7P1_BAUVA|nr:hypothetical protein L6164_028752 [Bauhinia variegata]
MAPTTYFIALVFNSTLVLINTNKAKKPKFPSILIFGDSTVDTGNNNFIDEAIFLKANHYPYGKDFPGHVANGRFSNAKLIPDMLASMLDIKETVPPFLNSNLSDHQLLTGVNFASSGAGFDDLTLSALHAIPVLKQTEYFKNYTVKLKKIAGNEETEKILEGALVIVSAGTNDFTLNFYILPIRALEYKFNISAYQDFLQSRLQIFIEKLYELGLRKIAVAGLPPVGCLPLQMTLKFENPKHRECVESQNSDCQLYNQKLAKLLPQIEAKLSGSKVVYTNIYDPLLDMINHPQKYGFEISEKGCCGRGLLAAGPLCNVLTPTCDDASKYMFWDSIHPTEAAYQYIAEYVEEHVLPKLYEIEPQQLLSFKQINPKINCV